MEELPQFVTAKNVIWESVLMNFVVILFTIAYCAWKSNCQLQNKVNKNKSGATDLQPVLSQAESQIWNLIIV